MNVRTRFPPSPTGPLHMGNVRTLLFNYLFAKKEGGKIVLRIEDTDKERSKPEWEQDIVDNLKWLGLEWDEGPIRQSERTEIYAKYLTQLLEQGKAYWCFCSAEELEAQRQDQMSRGVAPKYKGTCRSLSREQQLKSGKTGVIRFFVPEKTITFKDLIRGEISFDMGLVGDIVLAKDLETPLYNFTVVVDDFLMKITHIIRGEDHISNTPKQILLQEALGFSSAIRYAHLPLILGEDRTKLSKRHGDNSVTKFRKEGYLPEAVVNFLALLGWNPGDDREIFSLSSLLEEFSLEKIQRGGAIFNIQRLDWLNGFYIRKTSLRELTKLCIPYLKEANYIEIPNKKTSEGLEFIIKETKENISFQSIEKIVGLYQERLKKLAEIVPVGDFFFQKKLQYPKELLRWKESSDTETQSALEKLESILASIEEKNWTREALSQILLPLASKEKDRGYLLWPFRVALTGKKASAGPFEISEILGKEKTLQRVTEAKQLIKN